MPSPFKNQFVLPDTRILWLPTAVPPYFQPTNRATWPPDAFLLPSDYTSADLLAELRQHLNPHAFVEYCTTHLEPRDHPADVRETLAVRARAAAEAAQSDAETEARRRSDSAARAARRKKALEARRERLAQLKRTLQEKDFELPPPKPPAAPAKLAEYRARILARGPKPDSVAVPGSPNNTSGSFEVNRLFRDFTGNELNFLVWADQMSPQSDGISESWLRKLLKIDLSSEAPNPCGQDWDRRLEKIVRWLYDYYVLKLPDWLSSVGRARVLRGDAEGPDPALPDAGVALFSKWEPSYAAARLFGCTEGQLSLICREKTGLNARELWDLVLIRHAGVLEIFSYEMRLVRYEGYDYEPEEPGAEGVRAAVKRARRDLGRLRSTLAQRLGFLNHARLDRAFYNATGQALSEHEAQLYEVLSQEGTIEEQMRKYLDQLAATLTRTDLPKAQGQPVNRAGYKERVRRTPCTNLKNLVRTALVADATVLWYTRRREKLRKQLEEADTLPETTNHSYKICTNNSEDHNQVRINSHSERESNSEYDRPRTNELTHDSERQIQRPDRPERQTPRETLGETRPKHPPTAPPDRQISGENWSKRQTPSENRSEARAKQHALKRMPTPRALTPEELERLRWELEHEWPERLREWEAHAREIRATLAEVEPGPAHAALEPRRRAGFNPPPPPSANAEVA